MKVRLCDNFSYINKSSLVKVSLPKTFFYSLIF